mgnify:CR=1 FL=1
MKNIFRTLVVLNAVGLTLIIAWGAYQTSTTTSQGPKSATDIGGVLFMLFSIAYFVNSYLIYRFNRLGKVTYIPLVVAFIIIGFIGELVSPMQVNRDLFYGVVFYLISPAFFIVQGLILGFLYFSSFEVAFEIEKG